MHTRYDYTIYTKEHMSILLVLSLWPPTWTLNAWTPETCNKWKMNFQDWSWVLATLIVHVPHNLTSIKHLHMCIVTDCVDGWVHRIHRKCIFNQLQSFIFYTIISSHVYNPYAIEKLKVIKQVIKYQYLKQWIIISTMFIYCELFPVGIF